MYNSPLQSLSLSLSHRATPGFLAFNPQHGAKAEERGGKTRNMTHNSGEGEKATDSEWFDKILIRGQRRKLLGITVCEHNCTPPWAYSHIRAKEISMEIHLHFHSV